MAKTDPKWTIVQHSAYGYKGEHQFEKGLESREVRSREAQRAVEKVGGQLFDSYIEAETWAAEEQYPDPSYRGLIPQAPGEFAETGVNGLAIYVPRGVEK